MGHTFNVGDLAILEWSYCFPELNGEICEIVAPLKARGVCRMHAAYETPAGLWVDCYLVNIEGAKAMPLAAEPRQLKPLPGEYEPGSLHEIQRLLKWVPQVNAQPRENPRPVRKWNGETV